MSDPIEAHELRKSFHARGKVVEAVRGVGFTVPAGQIFGFLGPNGAGKTTTLRMLTTLLPIDSGTATVAGFDVGTTPRVRTRIGYVSQLGGADDLATGREELVLQGRLYGGEPAAVAARVERVIELLDLASFADRPEDILGRPAPPPRRRSRDRARARGAVPRRADDGPGPAEPRDLWEHVRRLQERGATVLLPPTTSRRPTASAIRMIIDHGEIVAEGSPRELKRDMIGDSVVLRVADNDRGERARALLAAAPFVSEVSTAGDGELRCYVDDGAAALPEILRLLDGAHIALRQISLSEPTLDDVFLAKTGRSLRDAGPATEEVQQSS